MSESPLTVVASKSMHTANLEKWGELFGKKQGAVILVHSRVITVECRTEKLSCRESIDDLGSPVQMLLKLDYSLF